MLKSAGPSISPELDQMVADLLKEDSDYDRHENRSAHRLNLVRSVILNVRRPAEKELVGFSRNISETGIGLITSEPIQDRANALLTIERLHGPSYQVLAECRWCKPYGENWYITGWQFMMMKN